jgi:GNAT superfamily N-acetyltransferase
MDVLALNGPEAAAHLPELARLRIEVFRDFPYLYDGDTAYEETYLREFFAAPGALLVLVREGGRVVGASTAMPMEHAHAEFIAPFGAAGIAPESVFYFGESVLDPAWRGRGLGHAFFDAREARARALGRRLAAFCAVERAPDHPRRPAAYRPLDEFWGKRGFHKRPDLRTSFEWKDLDETNPTAKPMVFWVKELT